MNTGARLALALLLGLGAVGCTSSAASTRNKSPLAPFKPALATSTLDVTFVQHEYQLPDLNSELWKDLDETVIPAEVRDALLKNGLRAGVIAGGFPMTLESMLKGASEESPASNKALASTPAGNQPASVATVNRRTLQALPRQRCEILASDVYERLNLLVLDDGGGRGDTYLQARCVLAVTATPLGDHRVRLSLVPEVQHGEPRPQYRGDDGMWRVDSARPKVALEKMAFDVVLAPGQTIVLGARTDRPGSVGHYFFTEPVDGQLEQKLLLIRFEANKYDQMLLTDRSARTPH